MIKIPHQMADYLCPVNGLCDIYEWKTGARIPEELLFFARPGFQMISQKRAAPPKMVFWGQGSIGKDQFNYWKDLVGYHIIAGEGKSYKSTVANIKALVEQKIPVVLFGLDMYHLPYHEHFYHTKHIPGHGRDGLFPVVAIGNMGAVAEIEQVFSGQQTLHLPDDAEAPDPGVQDPDRAVLIEHRMPPWDG